MQPDRRWPALSGIARLILVDFVEVTAALVICALALLTGNTELLHITEAFAAIMVASKLSIRLIIEETKEQLIASLAPLQRLERLVDLQSTSGLDELEKIVRAFSSISEPELRRVKQGILQDTVDRLQQLGHRLASEELGTGEYYEWLLPMMRELGSGDRVQAVSLMHDAEWDDSEVERKFLEENLAAARRGAIVERVFVIPEASFEAAILNRGIMLHRPRSGTDLLGAYVTREYLARHDPDLLRRIGDGFIQIGERVALVDRFSEAGEVRGYVTMNPAALRNLSSVFGRLRTLATWLPPAESKPRRLSSPASRLGRA